MPSYVREQDHLNDVVGDVPLLKVRCGAPETRVVPWAELVCFERDWQWPGHRPASPRKDDEQANKQGHATEPATKKRKLKVNKQLDLNSFLAGL